MALTIDHMHAIASPASRLDVSAHVASAAVAVGGVAVLAGWALHNLQLASLLPGTVSMKPNAALGVVALAGSILLSAPGALPWSVRIARLFGSVAILVGLLTLVEYATAVDLHIDQVLLRDITIVDPARHPGRMAPGTALALVALGYGVLGRGSERRHQVHELLAVGVAGIALVGLLGYGYREPLLYQPGTSPGMAADTAAMLLILALAVIAMTPDGRIARLITSRGLGGLTFRRLLPVALLVPAVSGGALLWGERAGLYSPESGVAVLVALTLTFFSLVLWRTSERIESLDEERRVLIDGLERRVKERTAELEQSERHAFRLLEGMPVGVLVLNGDGRPAYANGMSKALLGQAVDPLAEIGHPAAAYRAGTDEVYPADRMPVVRALKGEVSHVDDMEVAQGDRRTRLEVRATPIIDDAGSIQYAIASFTDITERKRDQQLLDDRASELERRAVELEQTNHELEQFAYVASHDLQEPLRMVASYVQLLQKRYRGRFDADADEYIDFAVDGAARMQTLILDLLAYSRVGRSAEAPGLVAVNTCVATALGNLRAAIRESRATITCGELPEVEASRTELTQLFQNLIGNALKFRGDADPVIDIQAAPDGDSWQFSVRDNGIGIDSRQSKRIFMVFQRLHSRDAFPGTGIGLAICKKVVERHGGHIWVDSEPGAGATFRFTLPSRPR